MTLQEMVDAVQEELDVAPEFDGNFHDTWDDWFVANAKRFRRVLGELMVRSCAGIYFTHADGRSLALLEVTVTTDDGVRGLLAEWLRAAREKLAEQAVPA